MAASYLTLDGKLIDPNVSTGSSIWDGITTQSMAPATQTSAFVRGNNSAANNSYLTLNGKFIDPNMSYKADPFALTETQNQQAIQNNIENDYNAAADPTTADGMSTMDKASLGLAAVSTGLNAIGNYKNYRLQRDAIEDQIKNSEMNRQLAADQYLTQQGVSASLGSAFGNSDSKKRYDKAKASYGKYTSTEA